MLYIWVFFAIVSLIYCVLIAMDNGKVIPDSFKRNKKHPFYATWRMFASSAFLILTGSFVLFAISTSIVSGTSNWWLIRILSFVMLALGLAVLFLINRKAINTFDPAFYQKFEEEERQKQALKLKKKEMKKQKKASK
jgi:cytochrome c biogenesis protein CcdA